MKIISRNVNGLRAVAQKWFASFIATYDPTVLCLQEVKCFEKQIPPEATFALSWYDHIRHQSEQPWYAGTAIFRKKWLHRSFAKNDFWPGHVFNSDGRVIQLDTEQFVLLNIYFPNGWTRADGREMLSFKLSFYDAVISYCDTLVQQGKNIIITGDFNICHTEQDIARPKENENSIWFLPIEREKIGELFAHGYVDIFRHFVPTGNWNYTWRSYRAGARPRNIWRRLDYFAVHTKLLPQVKKMEHLSQVGWSDHCPILLELDM